MHHHIHYEWEGLCYFIHSDEGSFLWHGDIWGEEVKVEPWRHCGKELTIQRDQAVLRPWCGQWIQDPCGWRGKGSREYKEMKLGWSLGPDHARCFTDCKGVCAARGQCSEKLLPSAPLLLVTMSCLALCSLHLTQALVYSMPSVLAVWTKHIHS